MQQPKFPLGAKVKFLLWLLGLISLNTGPGELLLVRRVNNKKNMICINDRIAMG